MLSNDFGFGVRLASDGVSHTLIFVRSRLLWNCRLALPADSRDAAASAALVIHWMLPYFVDWPPALPGFPVLCPAPGFCPPMPGFCPAAGFDPLFPEPPLPTPWP